MLIIKAFHIITMVAWFAALFYLPRLFVYHAKSVDMLSCTRFKLMESRLFYGIMCPAAILSTLLGLWLLSYNWEYYLKTGWMQLKLILVAILWCYHLLCGYFMQKFANFKNTRSAYFYKIFNEIPTLLLICIVLLVVLKPQALSFQNLP